MEPPSVKEAGSPYRLPEESKPQVPVAPSGLLQGARDISPADPSVSGYPSR